MKMKLSLRIPLTLTVIVFMTGIIVFIKRMAGSLPLPSSSTIIIWVVACVILIGITVWSWLRDKGKK